MKFTDEPTAEQEIYNYLISRQRKFTVKCIEFDEKIISGTDKERERKCKAYAKKLAELLNDC